MQLPQIPENISDEIFAILVREENEALIDRIADEHQLREDQIFRLSAVIGLAIMGAIQLKDLATALAEELDIGLEEAKRVALFVLLEIIYPFWPIFPDIDAVIKDLGGKVPAEKPAMPKLGKKEEGMEEEAVVYPDMGTKSRLEIPELLGGMEIPVPLPPKAQNYEARSTNYGVVERDVPWTPQTSGNLPRTVARPGDVSKLLEKNLLQKREESQPKIKGNVVDLSQ